VLHAAVISDLHRPNTDSLVYENAGYGSAESKVSNHLEQNCLRVHIRASLTQHYIPDSCWLIGLIDPAVFVIIVKDQAQVGSSGTAFDYGRAIAQAVSRWLPTVTVRVLARVWSSGICVAGSGAGVGFLRVLRFPLPIFISSCM
jgi:hypothetical protein